MKPLALGLLLLAAGHYAAWCLGRRLILARGLRVPNGTIAERRAALREQADEAWSDPRVQEAVAEYEREMRRL